MLKRFRVEGYRCFRDGVTLDLGRPHTYGWHNDPTRGDGYISHGIISNALIMGGNASGKTNLGWALMDVKENFRRSFVRRVPYGDSDPIYLNGDSKTSRAFFEYAFLLDGIEAVYAYAKDDAQRIRREYLLVDGETVFSYDSAGGEVDRRGLSLVGAENLSWDFSYEEPSVLAYLSNSLPRAKSPIVYAVRSFIERMDMLDVSASFLHTALMRAAVGVLTRDAEALREFEMFLRDCGVDERLVVRDGPDGSPVLYFRHDRLVPFSQACSSGARTLLLLFSRFFGVGPSRDPDGLHTGLPSLLYVDEFDAYLHYEVAAKLVRRFGAAGSCQTLCSTHNTSLVKNETMRPDCVFEISRDPLSDGFNGAGGLSIKSLADRTEREIRRGNNVEHLLRNGEFS